MSRGRRSYPNPAGQGERQPRGLEPGMPAGRDNLVWSLVFVAAAVVGALAAADIVNEQHPYVTVPIGIIIGLVAVVLLYRGSLDGDPEPVTPPAQPEPQYAQQATRPLETGAQGRSGAGWWAGGPRPEAAAVKPAAGRRGEQPGSSAPFVPEWGDLSAVQIAQCPNCGSFAVDGRESKPAWQLGCRDCAHSWNWHKGAPWPPVQVRPELRGP